MPGDLIVAPGRHCQAPGDSIVADRVVETQSKPQAHAASFEAFSFEAASFEAASFEAASFEAFSF